jgi:hypothetical protein
MRPCRAATDAAVARARAAAGHGHASYLQIVVFTLEI